MQNKKYFLALMLLAMLCMPWMSRAQYLSDYITTSGVDASRWISISSTTSIIGTGDGSASTVQNIGFNFPFAEGNYTQFSVNSDGNLRLGPTANNTSAYSTPFSTSYSNQNNPKINAFGNDGYSVANKHYVRTELQGTAPNRVRVVEYCIGTYNNSTRDSLFRFQVQLHENGDFCVVYKAAGRAPQVARQTGACVNSSDIVLFNNANLFNSYTAGLSTTTWGINQWPDEGRYYNFQRPVITCPPVVNITRLANHNNVQLAWSEQSSASQWLVTLTSGNTEVQSLIANDTNITISGLTPQTSYVATIRALCGLGDTSAARSTSFTTPCAPIAHSDLPITDDFESYTASSSALLSPCYYKYYNGSHTTTSYPYPSSTTAASGSKSLYFYSSNTAGYYSYLVLPQTEDAVNTLECVIKLRRSASTYAGRFQVGVIEDPEDFSTFTPLNDITLSTVNQWEEFTTYFGAYWGQGLNICLVAPQTTASNYIYLDDLIVRPISGCPAVSNLEVSTSDGQATFSWHENGTATSWMLYLAQRDSSLDAQSTLYAVSTDTTYTFSGISNNSPYTVYLIADCLDGASDTVALNFFSYCSQLSYTDLPYTETFDGYTSGSANPINPCWHKGTSSTSTAYPYPYSSAAITGPIGLRFYSYRPSSATGTLTWSYCALPAIDPSTDVQDLALFFDQKRYTSTTASYLSSIVVGLMSDPTDITTFDTVQVFDLTAEPASTVVHQVCSFTNYHGNGRYPAFFAPVPTLPDNVTYAYNYCDIDNVVLNMAPLCARPDSLQASVITPNSITFTWQCDGEDNTYLVQTDTNDAVVVPSMSYTLNGLDPASLHTITVRSICWTGDTSDAISLTIRSACGQVQLPYTEGFENYTTSTNAVTGFHMPCWEYQVTGTSAYNDPMYDPIVYYSPSYAASGNYSLRLYADGLHTMPAMPVSLSQLMLSFSDFGVSPDYHLELYALEDTGYAFIADITNQSPNGREDHMLFLNQLYSGNSHTLVFRNRNVNTTSVVYYSYHYIDDIFLDLLPSCFPVDNLHVSDLAGTTASIEWTSNAAMKEVRLESQGTLVSTSIVTDNYIDLTNLLPQTEYTAHVRAICADDDTSMWRQVSFTTTCNAAQVPWSENFDQITTSTTAATGIQPNCWHWDMTGTEYYQTNSYLPQVYYSSTYAHSGSYSLRLSGESNTSLPTFEVQADSLKVDFWARHSQMAYGLQVGVMEGSTFVPVQNITFSSTSASEHFTVYLYTYEGTSHTIAFRNYNTDGGSTVSYIYLDDISVDLLPSCYPIDHLQADSVLPTQVILSWGGNASSYEVEYGPAGFTQGQGTTLTTNTPSITLSNLTGNTAYDAYVRGICSTSEQTDWTLLSFYSGCSIVTDFPWSENFDNITTSTANATGVMPNCWDWTMLSDYYNSGTYLPQIYRSATYATSGMYSLRLYGNSIVTLPEFGPTVDSLSISFNTRTSSLDYQLQLGVIENGAFVPVQNITYAAANTTQPVLVYLNSYHGNSHILAFRNLNADPDEEYSYHYIDNIVVDRIPSCMPVTNLHVTDASTMSIELDWTSSASNWQIEYGPAGFTQGQGTTIDVTSHPATIYGLEASTTYAFYVRPVCTVDDLGPWSPVLVANTTCTTINAPYRETFDYTPAVTYNAVGELPGCWDAYTNGASQAYLPHVVGQGEYWYADSAHSLVMTSGSGADYGNTKLVRLPQFTQPVNSLTMSFWMSTESNSNGTLTVGYFTNSATTPESFVPLTNIYASSLTYAGSGVGQNANGYRDTVSFENVPDNAVAIGFRWSFSATYYSCCIDDVEVTSSNTCTLPLVVVDSVSNSFATLSWEGPSDSYEVSLSQSGSDNWTTDVVVTGFTHTFTNLMPSTDYVARVRALCDDNTTSPYAYRPFTTDELPCLAPSALVATPSFASVTVDWTPQTQEHSWELHLQNTTIDTSILTQVHPFVVNGLVSGMTYSISVRALCGDNANVPSLNWSDSISFTTEQCDVPSNLSATVNLNSATLTWTPGQNNNGNWVIEYGPQGFSAGSGTIVNATTTTVTLSDLDWNTDYDAYVRANCEAGAFSDWSNKATFSTMHQVGIADAEHAQMSIYPNPAFGSTSISLSGVSGNVRLTIVDMNGRTIHTEETSCDGSCVKVLNIEGLSSGAYFVRLRSDNLNSVKKLIVK